MADLERQLREDRMLRDAARALLVADVAHLKRGVNHETPSGPDLTMRARDLPDDTRDYLSAHRFQVGAVVAALVAAIALWLLREPLAAMVREVLADDEAEEEDPEQAGDDNRSAYEPELPVETPA